MHLGRNHGSGEDTATDGDFAGEGTFLIYSSSVSCDILEYHRRLKEVQTDVGSVNRSLGGPKAQSNVLEPSPPTLSGLGTLGSLCFRIDEDVGLLLERTLRLNCQFCRHSCARFL